MKKFSAILLTAAMVCTTSVGAFGNTLDNTCKTNSCKSYSNEDVQKELCSAGLTNILGKNCTIKNFDSFCGLDGAKLCTNSELTNCTINQNCKQIENTCANKANVNKANAIKVNSCKANAVKATSCKANAVKATSCKANAVKANSCKANGNQANSCKANANQANANKPQNIKTDANNGNTAPNNKPNSDSSVNKPAADTNISKPADKLANENNNQSTSNASYAEQVVRLVNDERAKAGLAPVAIDTKVTSAAQLRATEIKTLFSHTRPNGSSCFTALAEKGASYRGAGENIAYGQKTPEEVMNGWMNSEGHRANILKKEFTHIGVGYYKDASGTNYWTQFFTY